jgi:glycosyltransferase involved in cell wall biosynthesis
MSLGHYKWFNKLIILKKFLMSFKDKQSVATISMGLSADFFNTLCHNYVGVSFSTVRGNLPMNYYFHYGLIGRLIAYLHLKQLKKIDVVISMTSSMSKQVNRYIGKNSPIIRNFIDENSLQNFRKTKNNKGIYRFIFTGSLTNRKQPALLINSIFLLLKNGENVCLDILGDGPLLNYLKNQTKELGIDNRVKYHGFINQPFNYIKNADVLVLPSMSEGIPRSALEALYIGIPCILRNVDGNSELIRQGENGYLFHNDTELPQIMLDAARLSRNRDRVFSLLPKEFYQKIATKKILELLEIQR